MPLKLRGKDGADPKERALWGDLLSLGMVFPAAIVMGFYFGRWIGGAFGHRTAGGYVGLVWGILTAFWELIKLSNRMSRADEAARKKAEGEAPGPAGGEGEDHGR